MRGKPTFNNIILRVVFEKEVEQKTKSGIILPNGVDQEDAKKMRIFKEHPVRGEVIAVGPSVTICKPGDWCYFNRGLEDLIEDSVYYSIAREHDVLYVVEKEEYEEAFMKKSSEAVN